MDKQGGTAGKKSSGNEGIEKEKSWAFPVNCLLYVGTLSQLLEGETQSREKIQRCLLER